MSEYLSLRADTIGVQPVLHLNEVLGEYEVPQRAFYSEHLTNLRAIVSDVVVLDNDVRSYPKELARGDLNNILILISDRRNCFTGGCNSRCRADDRRQY